MTLMKKIEKDYPPPPHIQNSPSHPPLFIKAGRYEKFSKRPLWGKPLTVKTANLKRQPAKEPSRQARSQGLPTSYPLLLLREGGKKKYTGNEVAIETL